MKHGLTLLWMVTVVVTAILILVAGGEYSAARTRARSSTEKLAAITRQASELAALRSSEDAATSRTTGRGLTESLSEALARAGLPASMIASVTPDQDRMVNGPAGTVAATRRKASVILAGPTLPQVGSFLQAWRASEPGWVVSSVDLAPLPSGAPAGGDLPLRATLNLESIEVRGAAQ